MVKNIKIDKDILGGTPVFPGTRVPVTALFDYLEDGDSIDEFLLDFPSVTRKQAIALLADVRKEMMKILLDECVPIHSLCRITWHSSSRSRNSHWLVWY